jgi:hypothetical protein
MVASTDVVITESIISNYSSLSPVMNPYSINYLIKSLNKCIYPNVKSNLNLCFSSRLGGPTMYKVPFAEEIEGFLSLIYSLIFSRNSLKVSDLDALNSAVSLQHTRHF